MDTHERALVRSYNQALAQLRSLPKADPRHARASVKVLYWQRVIKKYRRSQSN